MAIEAQNVADDRGTEKNQKYLLHLGAGSRETYFARNTPSDAGRYLRLGEWASRLRFSRERLSVEFS